MKLSPYFDIRYTYADYMMWPDDERCELVNGFVRTLTSPGTRHQETSGTLLVRLFNMIEKNKVKCKIYPAPFDVRLQQNGEEEDELIYNVVQPDICIVCDLSKIDGRGCLGAPDFVAEIQSPSTSKYDRTSKFGLYEATGVREYWVVYPTKRVDVFLLQADGKYDRGTIYESGKIPVRILGGLSVDMKDLF